nr:hypothetical protein [Candidatus Scalindua japonica]
MRDRHFFIEDCHIIKIRCGCGFAYRCNQEFDGEGLSHVLSRQWVSVAAHKQYRSVLYL